MRRREFAIALALGIALSGRAMGQQAGHSSAEFEAEQKVALEAIMEAEKRLAAGETRGPNSAACGLMASYYLHTVKAAAAAGASTRIADWPDLSSAEQEAVMQSMKGKHARNKRLRQHACTPSHDH
jgi:hypothetical protein